MKQPQLGEKILELRLAKGLTQTELAEKCNLSLRTIQRVELAEVTPRSYTLKLIFKTLDFDGFNVESKNSSSSYNLKKDVFRNILLIIVTAVISILIFKYITNYKRQSAEEVKNSINKSQINFRRWVKTNQVDSLLTLYRKDACWLNSICGKVAIGARLQSAINNGYEFIEYKTLSISIGDTIAVEKYHSLYKYRGDTKEQFGMTEWRFTNGTWLILNDFFYE
ncbi:helix-turn-helix domain-containing protein [Aquimarina aggregata]|uniref:helix-turn-helix domain-containing protein n=1 Tax=Aquimarina aggregata TaxID=1642818 RepID=UPI002490A031|nr:helix-turn-helix domain-containing protein [Aquimarina aggregata]